MVAPCVSICLCVCMHHPCICVSHMCQYCRLLLWSDLQLTPVSCLLSSVTPTMGSFQTKQNLTWWPNVLRPTPDLFGLMVWEKEYSKNPSQWEIRVHLDAQWGEWAEMEHTRAKAERVPPQPNHQVGMNKWISHCEGFLLLSHGVYLLI